MNDNWKCCREHTDCYQCAKGPNPELVEWSRKMKIDSAINSITRGMLGEPLLNPQEAVNDKQAGDVKRYHFYASGREVVANERVDGEFVRFSDIAHLLKPQKPGQIIQSSANRVGKTYALALEAKIEKLEAENRRLRGFVEKFLKVYQSVEEFVGTYDQETDEIEPTHYVKTLMREARKALNSGGVK